MLDNLMTRSSADRREVEQLLGLVAQLEAENTHLRALLRWPRSYPGAWDLTAQQRQLLALIQTNYGCSSNEYLRTGLAAGGQEISYRHLMVVMHHLRAKLKPYGIQICNRRAQGFYLPDHARRALDAAVAQAPAGQAA